MVKIPQNIIDMIYVKSLSNIYDSSARFFIIVLCTTLNCELNPRHA